MPSRGCHPNASLLLNPNLNTRSLRAEERKEGRVSFNWWWSLQLFLSHHSLLTGIKKMFVYVWNGIFDFSLCLLYKCKIWNEKFSLLGTFHELSTCIYTHRYVDRSSRHAESSLLENTHQTNKQINLENNCTAFWFHTHTYMHSHFIKIYSVRWHIHWFTPTYKVHTLPHSHFHYFTLYVNVFLWSLSLYGRHEGKSFTFLLTINTK